MAPTAFGLPAELTIYTVGELHPQCLAWLADTAAADSAAPGECCVVDGAAVDQIDGAGLQLLVALWAALRHRKCSVQLVQASAPLRSACEALGLSALLATIGPTGAST